jgi:16S rRNA (cytidine1402-2'-O)-methyltransferase
MASGRRGVLYVVGTPIGNLEDITLRALRVLREVDLIAAEDSRTIRRLLTSYHIRTPVKSYHEQGEARKGRAIVRQLKEGKDVALVSEAGTPGISDPGYELIQLCLSEGIEPVVVPGPSVVVAALSVSGLPTDRFAFEGFLPRKRSERLRALKGLRQERRTLVFFESPRRLRATLEDMLGVFGDRKAALAREMTKVFEEVRRGSVGELLAWTKEETIMGEVTLLVHGDAGGKAGVEGLRDRIEFLLERCRLGERDVVRLIHEESGIPRKSVYRALLDYKGTRG